MSAWNAGQRIGPELAGAERQVLGRVGPVAADVEGQAVEAGGVEEGGHRQRPVARRLPAVDEDDARTRVRRPRAGMNHAGSGSPSDSMSIDSYGRPRSAGVMRGGLRRG